MTILPILEGDCSRREGHSSSKVALYMSIVISIPNIVIHRLHVWYQCSIVRSNHCIYKHCTFV